MDRRTFLATGATVALLPLAEAPALGVVTRAGSGDAKLNALFEVFVAGVWNELRSMITGWYVVRPEVRRDQS